jgi:hypothetical protein
MSPAVTLERAKGFTLYMMKALIGVRTDELVDLARSNVWRKRDLCIERVVPDAMQHDVVHC